MLRSPKPEVAQQKALSGKGSERASPTTRAQSYPWTCARAIWAIWGTRSKPDHATVCRTGAASAMAKSPVPVAMSKAVCLEAPSAAMRAAWVRQR